MHDPDFSVEHDHEADTTHKDKVQYVVRSGKEPQPCKCDNPAPTDQPDLQPHLGAPPLGSSTVNHFASLSAAAFSMLTMPGASRPCSCPRQRPVCSCSPIPNGAPAVPVPADLGENTFTREVRRDVQSTQTNNTVAHMVDKEMLVSNSHKSFKPNNLDIYESLKPTYYHIKIKEQSLPQTRFLEMTSLPITPRIPKLPAICHELDR